MTKKQSTDSLDEQALESARQALAEFEQQRELPDGLSEEELLERGVQDLNETYDLDERPAGFFGEDGELQSNIFGEWRRQAVRDELGSGRGESIPEALFASRLDDRLRAFVGGIHPQMMGGEYLPELDESEVEIARVSLKSTTGDVLCVRARREAREIRYRVVDEYPENGDYLHEYERSALPLTFGELVHLIDSAGRQGESYGHERGAAGLVMGFYYQQWECGDDLQRMLDFVTVSSEFYPELGTYYEERGELWRRVVDEERGVDEEDG